MLTEHRRYLVLYCNAIGWSCDQWEWSSWRWQVVGWCVGWLTGGHRCLPEDSCRHTHETVHWFKHKLNRRKHLMAHCTTMHQMQKQLITSSETHLDSSDECFDQVRNAPGSFEHFDYGVTGQWADKIDNFWEDGRHEEIMQDFSWTMLDRRTACKTTRENNSLIRELFLSARMIWRKKYSDYSKQSF